MKIPPETDRRTMENVKNYVVPLFVAILGGGGAGYVGVSTAQATALAVIQERIDTLTKFSEAKAAVIDSVFVQSAVQQVESEARKRWMAKIEITTDKLQADINQIKIDLAKSK